MLRIPRQTVDLPSNLPSSIVSIISSTGSDTASSVTSSDPSSQPTSTPSSQPPTSIETTSSNSTSQPPPSDIASLPQSSNSTSVDPSTSAPPILTGILPVNSSASVAFPSRTQNITTVVTKINGQSTTFTSILPTNLADDTSNASNGRRTAVIAGTTFGLFALVLILLVAIFAYRKRQLRKTLAVSGKKREGKSLLDGEDFDDDEQAQMRTFAGSTTYVPRPMSPAPSLLKSRTSEAGSIFREEIWPPPGFVDPIAKRSSQVDLSRIVEDVMGPTGFASASGSGHSFEQSQSSTSRLQGSHQRGLTDTSTASAESHLSSSSTNSKSDLLPAANASSSTSNNPFASPSSQASVHSPTMQLPAGALAPTTPGASTALMTTLSPMTSASSFSHTTASAGSSNPISPSIASSQTPIVFPPAALDPRAPSPQFRQSTQPKKSSPLARALTGDARMLIGEHGVMYSNNPPPS